MFENLRTYFDRVVVLNLAERADRWTRFLRSLPQDWPFRVPLRFPAVKGDLSTVPSWWKESPGAWGCYRSHLKVIQDAIRDQVNSILILEDDAIFCEDFGTLVRQFLLELPDDWSMIYLGGEHIEWEMGLPVKIRENVYRPFNVNRTHCYAIRGRSMLQSIANHLEPSQIKTSQHHIDHHLGEFQKATESEGVYVPRKWLIGQAGGASDVATWKTSATFFPDSYHFAEPKVDRELIVIASPLFTLSQQIARVVRSCGIPTKKGERVAKLMTVSEDSTDSVVDSSFEYLMSTLFEVPSMLARTEQQKRQKLLQIWSSVHCSSFGDRYSPLYLTHPLIPVVLIELSRIWTHLKVVAVKADETEVLNQIGEEQPGWSAEKCVQYARVLIESCELAEQVLSPRVLCLSSSELSDSPDTVGRSIKAFVRN